MTYRFSPDPHGTHAKLLKYTGKNKNVLEVGCATGYISEKLKENGCNVVGIEINPEAADVAKKHCDSLIVGDIELLESLPLEENYFDVILFGDVIEHSKNPSNVLSKMKKYLKEEGQIVVSVPNIANIGIRLQLFFLGRFDYGDWGILDRTHLRFFTLKTFKQVIKDAGFRIIIFDVAPPGPSFHGRFKIYQSVRISLTKLFKSLLAYQFIAVAKKDIGN